MATARGLEPAVKAGLVAPYDSWANRIAIARFVQDIPLAAGHPSFELCRWVDENLQVLRDRPTLVCWGRQDFVFDDDFLAEWRRRFPKAEFHAWEDAGHYVLEDARERIVKLVQDFLARD
jgi:haloalkane dehalogenase